MVKSNFVRDIVDEHLRSGRFDRVHTRFPPEPNGYLHIGHAKSLRLNFGLARDYDGLCNLRMDDTNPETEDIAYVDAIKEDVRWLGFDWEDREYYASDYYEKLYDFAVLLIEKGVAYVCDLTRRRGPRVPRHGDEARRRQPLPRPLRRREPRPLRPHAGRRVPRRLARPSGPRSTWPRPTCSSATPSCTASAASATTAAATPGASTRPTTGPTARATRSRASPTPSAPSSSRSIAPSTTGSSTSSASTTPSRSSSPASTSATPSSPSARLLELVEAGLVDGWDDPRMPTISGFRRRGYTPESIAAFADTIGVAKDNSIVDMPLLEMCVRDHLNRTAPRVMAVLRPLKVVITNYPEDKVEELEAVNNPEDPAAGTRKVPFSRELYIERDDFMEDPPPKFYRLGPGREVRLRYAYFIKCVEVDQGRRPATSSSSAAPTIPRPAAATTRRTAARSRPPSTGSRPRHAIDAEVRLYDTLLTVRDPSAVAEGVDWKSTLNPRSLEALPAAKLEPALAAATPESRWQFERLGYFVADRRDSQPGALVFNRTVTLRDEWAKLVKAGRDAA